MHEERGEDGGVEDFVGQEHLGAGFGEGCGVEIKEAEEIGEDGEVRHESEEWDQPDDVPGVVRGEEEHQSGGEREGGRKEGGVSGVAEVIERVTSLLACGLPTPPQDGSEDGGAEDEVGSGGEVVQAGDSLGEFEEEVA